MRRGRRDQFEPSNPFEADDPFAPRAMPVDGVGIRCRGGRGHGRVDPIELLGLAPRPAPPRKPAHVNDFERGTPLDEHYQPPAAIRRAGRRAAGRGDIPFPRITIRSRTSPDRSRALPGRIRRSMNAPHVTPTRTNPRRSRSPATASSCRAASAAAHGRPSGGAGRLRTYHRSGDGAGGRRSGSIAVVTPELARSFGQILRVVVSGVMDVMRSRQQIKDEFRMRMTRFRRSREQPAQVLRERRRRAPQSAGQAQSRLSDPRRRVRRRL